MKKMSTMRWRYSVASKLDELPDGANESWN
jgi:hypothetical protein